MNHPEKVGPKPMLTKVTDDIYKLSVRFPFGVREMNSYLIKGDHGFTIIDTGSEATEAINIWESTIASLGITIEKVVLTHAHSDHIGLARWFQEQYHVPVYISSTGYKEIQKKRDNYQAKWLNIIFKQHGGPKIPEEVWTLKSDAYELEPDGLYENHQKIKLGNDLYETIWTPGHSLDHFCFYNQEKQVMVLGDLVLNDFSPIIGVWSADENPLKDYFESVKKIKTYSSQIVLPGHGGLIADLEKKVDETIKGHNHRFQQILESIKCEQKSAATICQEVYGNLSVDKIFAPLMTTISRLIYLESIGKISSQVKNQIIQYKSS